MNTCFSGKLYTKMKLTAGTTTFFGRFSLASVKIFLTLWTCGNLSKKSFISDMHFCTSITDDPAQAAEKINNAYGEGTMGRRIAFDWFAKFQDENFDLGDAPRSGRPSLMRTAWPSCFKMIAAKRPGNLPQSSIVARQPLFDICSRWGIRKKSECGSHTIWPKLTKTNESPFLPLYSKDTNRPSANTDHFCP